MKCPQIRAITYNILAPVFARPKNAQPGDFSYFDASSEADLNWSNRKRLIGELLTQDQADIITLQEVQFERVDKADSPWDLPSFLQLPGYGWAIPGFSAAEWTHQSDRNLRVLDDDAVTGVATLFKLSSFELVHSETTSRTLVVFLRCKHSSLEPLYCVGNVHLEGHPDLGDLRRKQLMSAIKKRKKYPTAHLLIMGDFNSVGNEVDEFNDSEHHLTHVRTGPTWSSGKSEATLDHILCEPTLKVDSVVEYYRPESDKLGMPNASSGSDHAPVGVVFSTLPRVPIKAAATLSDDAKEAIRKEWNALDQPEKSKGKPSAEEMILLKAFAVTKKQFLSQFSDGSLELAFAKKISK